MDLAADKALKMHKITVAKKAEEKKLKIKRQQKLKLLAHELQSEPESMDLTNDSTNNHQTTNFNIEMNTVSS